MTRRLSWRLEDETTRLLMLLNKIGLWRRKQTFYLLIGFSCFPCLLTLRIPSTHHCDLVYQEELEIHVKPISLSFHIWNCWLINHAARRQWRGAMVDNSRPNRKKLENYCTMKYSSRFFIFNHNRRKCANEYAKYSSTSVDASRKEAAKS